MPEVSVIVPVYNMELYLEECLNSILSQTLKNIEVIAINDGSTDRSLEILKKYQANDERVFIIDKKNAGVGAARNDGILASRGEYIAFMDPDDLYASDTVLEHCVKIAKEYDVPVAGGQMAYLYANGTQILETEKKVGNLIIVGNGLMEYSEYQYDYGYVCYIFKREMLIEDNILFPLYSRFQDPPFFVKAMMKAEKFYLLNEPVYLYRQLPGVTKHTPIKTIDFLYGVMDNLKISKKNSFAKLHYITMSRIYTEGSYMVTNNLNCTETSQILLHYMKAVSMIDREWLKEEGYIKSLDEIPEVFEYLISTTQKYERLRKKPVIREGLGVLSRLKRKREISGY